MLLLASALIAAAPTPAVAVPESARPIANPTRCPRTTQYYAWRRGKALKPQKLIELPPANAYYTVYRLIGGCEVPVVVKYGVGGP
jgi:hypothetical protein